MRLGLKWDARTHVRRIVVPFVLLGAVPFAACGTSQDAQVAADAGDEEATFIAPRDAGHHDEPPVDAKTPWERMQPHEHEVLASMRLQVVYLGFEGQDGAPSFDAFLQWLVTSDYWGIMQQYGVGTGSIAGSVRIPASAVIPPEAVKNGLLTAEDLDAFVHDAIHGAAGGTDAGPDGGDASDASSDATLTPLIPIADAYLFFLPVGVNVDLGERGGHVFQTCVDAGGYHSWDGAEPYAVIPPCSFGRSPLAVSHELAEMATDPLPNQGWYSDKDVDNAGGEIADLCNQAVPGGVLGWSVTQLWSNADGDCEPR
jgi:hypothetical protein